MKTNSDPFPITSIGGIFSGKSSTIGDRIPPCNTFKGCSVPDPHDMVVTHVSSVVSLPVLQLFQYI